MDLNIEQTSAMDTAVDATVTSAATKAMGGGAAVSLGGWSLSNDEVVLFGLLMTILGFAVNLIFQARRDYREQVLHAAKLALLSAQKTPIEEEDKKPKVE